jgi:hypothetical protein
MRMDRPRARGTSHRQTTWHRGRPVYRVPCYAVVCVSTSSSGKTISDRIGSRRGILNVPSSVAEQLHNACPQALGLWYVVRHQEGEGNLC